MIALLLATLMSAHALDLSFDKALKIEVDRCHEVLPIEPILEFAMVSDVVLLPEDEMKAKVGAEMHLQSLEERGEVIDLTGKDELTISCAKYAKGVLITPFQAMVAGMFRNLFTPETPAKGPGH